MKIAIKTSKESINNRFMLSPVNNSARPPCRGVKLLTIAFGFLALTVRFRQKRGNGAILVGEIFLRYSLYVFFGNFVVLLDGVKKPLVIPKEYFVTSERVRSTAYRLHLAIEIGQQYILSFLQFLIRNGAR